MSNEREKVRMQHQRTDGARHAAGRKTEGFKRFSGKTVILHWKF